MKYGTLAGLFDGVATKQLTASEVDPKTSHQHEIYGNQALKRLLGEPDDKLIFPTTLFYLDDSIEVPLIAESEFSWYDARKTKSHRASEWRLYFPKNEVTDAAVASDLLTIARMKSGELLAIVVPAQSTFASQVGWVFGADPVEGLADHLLENFHLGSEKDGLFKSLILEHIGVELDVPIADHLDEMISLFGNDFPTTRVFSEFARSKVSDVSPVEDPDEALVEWIAKEEAMFRTFERHLVSQRLEEGFQNDVDGFISYSLSVQNRRKSRMGHALEHHLKAVFTALEIRNTTRNATERGAKPDFLFPGLTEYSDPLFPTQKLTMLGAKSTSKDRWRQVLSEADRIKYKHLMTLEPAISTAQTSEMRGQNLQLIVPASIAASYTPDQQAWLMDVRAFTDLVRSRQR